MSRAELTVNSGSPRHVTATILAGAGGLSDAQKVDGKLSGVILTSAWVTAAMTFQGSRDGTVWFDLWDTATGTAVERTIAAANLPTSNGRFLALNLGDWIGLNWVKVRSGTSASPVNQTGGASIDLILAG